MCGSENGKLFTCATRWVNKVSMFLMLIGELSKRQTLQTETLSS